jgi:primosomal protein N' (replication factor Y) (superfamily II helicase)
MKSPSCIPHCPTKNAPSSGIASRAAKRAWSWARAPRSFAPVADLALIIVDEEHDSSYKQEETPRYHARDIAVMRAKMANAVVVLGSATPSLESYFNAKKNKYALVELPDRVEQRPLPEVEIIDMRQEFQETGQEQVISRKLAAEIKERFDRKEQVMVCSIAEDIHRWCCAAPAARRWNARTAPSPSRITSASIRWFATTADTPRPCPKPASIAAVSMCIFSVPARRSWKSLLHGMFPQARIARLDRDTVRGHEDFERTLNALNEGELDLLVGTQMIAKGHDIHGVTLVGVVGADNALGCPISAPPSALFSCSPRLQDVPVAANLPAK